MKNFLTILMIPSLGFAAPVTTTEELVKAVSKASGETTIELSAGTFDVPSQLLIKTGTTLTGAGPGKTIITSAPSFKGNPATLPDPEQNFKEFDRTGYLIQLEENATDITISELTLTGPNLHGAIFGWGNQKIHLHHLKIEDFMYSGFRSYDTRELKVHDCLFIDAGQRWERGEPGLKGGITGGGIFTFWLKDSEICNNRFLDTKPKPNLHYYGIKGRQAKRVHIHHNTIETNFSIEFAFENDEDVEIDHNICHGTISIPKHGGGPVPASGSTFHIHHNYFKNGYSIEYMRNGAEIHHNLFDFDPLKDGSNLISEFGNVPATGPTDFHNNLINNPGRGVIWMNAPYTGLTFRNNHVIARPTPTPRKEGLFGFNSESDFKTFTFKDNIIECIDLARPLFRNDESGQSNLSNNKLTNISDTSRYQNPATKTKAGLEAPLKFQCGMNGELTVDGWNTKLAP
jgi:hypothetical protein